MARTSYGPATKTHWGRKPSSGTRGRFESDHEIWRQLAGGDRTGVGVCAPYCVWKNTAKKGVLKVDEWFKPILQSRQVLGYAWRL